MSEAVFGKAGTFSFTVTKGESAETVAPNAIVSASLYSSTPTDAQIADDNNALAEAVQHKTAWASGANANEKLISYDAIADPEADANNPEKYEEYYWVVRYTLESGGATIRDLESMIVHRPEGVNARYNVTASDVYALEHKLEDVFSDKVPGKIQLAERLVGQELRGKGYDLRLLDWADARDLVRYKAVFLCCRSLAYDSGDVWGAKAESYGDDYATLMNAIPLGYDTDDDEVIEPGEEVQQRYAVGFLVR